MCNNATTVHLLFVIRTCDYMIKNTFFAIFLNKCLALAAQRNEQKGEVSLKKLKGEKKEQSGVPGADLHGRPLPTEVRACRRHWPTDLCFLSTSRCGNTSLSASRDGTGSSCMLDVLLNASFLDDMGDRSKSTFAEVLVLFFIYLYIDI